MKNLFKAGIVLMLFLAACSGNSPKGVADNFLKSLSKQDYEEAKKYGTEETGKLLDMISGFAKMMPDSGRNNKKEIDSEITGEKVDGDKATVTYKEKGKDGEQTLNLVKVDGKWKVAMSKDNMNGNGANMDSGATSSDSVASSGALNPPDSSAH